MTKPDLMAELAEVVRLSERATPGPWESASRGRYYVGQQEDEGSVHGANDTDIDEVSNVAPLHLADTIRGDCYFPDADLIAKAVNFLRTHHAELEAAVRERQDAIDALAMAYVAMNYMGDIINGMDAAEPADVKRVGPAFNAVRRVLSGKDSGIAQLIHTQAAQIEQLAAMHNSAREGL